MRAVFVVAPCRSWLNSPFPSRAGEAVSDRQDAPESAPGGAGQQLEKNEARGGFLGFVAHEMRNPLSTALWSAELLVRLAPEERAGPRGEKLTGMSLRALQRLRLLIEDHFLAERLEVGGIPFKVDDVVLREAARCRGDQGGLAELTVVIEDGIAVRADRGLLERALDGLLASAARGKSPVRVEGTRDGDQRPHPGDAARRRRPRRFAMPQKGTPSDPTGRALALHMVAGVARALGASLSATPERVSARPAARFLPCSPDHQ